MEPKKLPVVLDLVRSSNVILYFQQGEFGPEIDFTITQNGNAYNLTDTELKLNFKKPSGNKAFITGSIVTAESGKAKAIMTNQALAEAGKVIGQVVITSTDVNNETVIKTWTIMLYVQPSVAESGIESINESAFHTDGEAW